MRRTGSAAGPALFVLTALAAWLVWRGRKARPARVLTGVFYARLPLNIAWSGLFFGGGHRVGFLEIPAFTAVPSGRVRRAAGRAMPRSRFRLIDASALTGSIRPPTPASGFPGF